MGRGQEFEFPEEGLAPFALEDPIYSAAFDAWRHELVCGEEVSDGVAVSFLRSVTRGVTADSFRLREADRQPIDSITAPGKSAHIAFTPSPAKYSRLVIGKPPRTDFALADISAAELRSEGFHPLFAPLYDTPLHVRVVHDLHFRNPDSPEDIPYDARDALARIFNRELERNQYFK